MYELVVSDGKAVRYGIFAAASLTASNLVYAQAEEQAETIERIEVTGSKLSVLVNLHRLQLPSLLVMA